MTDAQTEAPLAHEDLALIKKLHDPKFFIESCLYIVNKDSEKVPFIFNNLQNAYYRRKSLFDIILKSRKMGFSSLITAMFLHSCVFEENTRAVIVSHEDGATKRLLEKVHYYIDTSEFPIRTKRSSTSEISFPDTNSTFYIGTAGQRAFARGDDLTKIHLSEFCWYPNFGIVTGIKEACRNDAYVVWESTANGAGTDAHKMWLRAIRGESSAQPIFFAWFENPEYTSKDNSPFELNTEERRLRETFALTYGQLRWRRQKISDMADPTLFPQEYPEAWEVAFLSSGSMVFDWGAIKRQEGGLSPVKWIGDVVNMGNKVVINPDTRGNITIWRTPKSTS